MLTVINGTKRYKWDEVLKRFDKRKRKQYEQMGFDKEVEKAVNRDRRLPQRFIQFIEFNQFQERDRAIYEAIYSYIDTHFVFSGTIERAQLLNKPDGRFLRKPGIKAISSRKTGVNGLKRSVRETVDLFKSWISSSQPVSLDRYNEQMTRNKFWTLKFKIGNKEFYMSQIQELLHKNRQSGIALALDAVLGQDIYKAVR